VPDTPPRPAARPPGPVRILRAIGPGGPITLALLGLAAIAASGEWSPAVSPEVADLRIWIVARSAGLISFVLVTALTLLGLVLSHPTNRTRWKASRHLFPWHRNLALFTVFFVGVHIAALALDPYAGVGLLGTFVPGLSGYRAPEVALGTLGLYALLLTGLTARFTNLLPAGRWMTVHRVALVAFALSWLHGVGAGTDTAALGWLYALSGAAVVLLAASRYWNPLPKVVRGAPPPERQRSPSVRISLWRSK
jgi:DMSO/TMAO reductase YedYZ heme-binding membrane subunit